MGGERAAKKLLEDNEDEGLGEGKEDLD
jgi:hypothetical protein